MAASGARTCGHLNRTLVPFALLLADIVMPGTTGLQWAGLYLAKPFSPEPLAVKVREVGGSPGSTGTMLVVDEESAIW